MRTTVITLLGLVWVAGAPTDSLGACPKTKLELYFPLNEGDVRYYSGFMGSCYTSVSRTWACGQSVLRLSETCSDSVSYYERSGTELRLLGGTGMGLDLCFSPPLIELDENIISNGGRRSSRSSGSVYYHGYWIDYTAEATVVVSLAGTITVPAGTYQNCRNVKVTIKMTVSLGGQSESETMTIEYYLAPGVGQIRLGVYNADGKRLGWQDLTSGQVAGTDVRWFAGAQSPVNTAQPVAQSLPVHGVAAFSVSASGTSPVGYRWMKNGADVNNSARIAGADTPSLTISDVQFSDANTYSVRVSNPLNCATSAGAVLNVVADDLPPTVIITSPAKGFATAKETKVFKGTATDNARVVRVETKVNTNLWTPATGTANWQAEGTLVPGTNRFRVRAVDASGLVSSMVEIKVFRIVESPVTISVDGCGTVTGATNGELLAIGRGYTVTAVACPDSLFSHWTANPPVPFPATSATGTFLMCTGQVLTAHFLPNPFLAVSGSYHGLFYELAGARHDSSGALELTVGEQGAYSAKLCAAGQEYPMSGQFDFDGRATNTTSCACGRDDLTVEWQLDVSQTHTNLLTGRVIPAGGGWEAQLLGDRAPVLGTNVSPYAGKYTVLIPGAREPSVIDRPVGDGFGAVTVNAAGLLSFAGRLADGKAVTQSAELSSNGIWPLYVSLYGGKGSILSWVQLNTNPPSVERLRGEPLLWFCPPKTNAAYFPVGFEVTTSIQGSAYNKKVKPLLPFTNGLLVLRGGSLSESITNRVFLTLSNTVVPLEPQALTMTITKSNGFFNGTFTLPGTNTLVPFQGALLQYQTNGAGYFRLGGQSGQVILESAEQ